MPKWHYSTVDIDRGRDPPKWHVTRKMGARGMTCGGYLGNCVERQIASKATSVER
jgi:hypothetical protein